MKMYGNRPFSERFRSTFGGPSYFIIAGLVFTVLSEPLLESEFGADWEHKAPIEMVKSAVQSRAASREQELVLLTQAHL